MVLSTEDAEVAEVAREIGIDVPFIRPPELASDPAGVVDVALHALDALERKGDRFETLIILLPTCPFRTADDVRAAYALYQERRPCFLMSVSPFSHTPFAAMSLDNKARLSPCFPNYIGRKSQEMPDAYRPNGAIHILDVDAFRRERSYFAEPLVGYAMPLERSVDIDTAMDLRVAEAMIGPGPKA